MPVETRVQQAKDAHESETGSIRDEHLPLEQQQERDRRCCYLSGEAAGAYNSWKTPHAVNLHISIPIIVANRVSSLPEACLLNRTLQATKFLRPEDHNCRTLRDVKPLVTGVFTLQLDQEAGYGHSDFYLRVEVDASPSEDDEDEFFITGKRYTVHEKSESSPLQLDVINFQK
jgi:hypothetical protein